MGRIFLFQFLLQYLLLFHSITYSGNAKEEPGAIVCRVAQSFLRFGSFQIHALRGKEDFDIVRALADYTIRHHFPHLENRSGSESLSFKTEGQEGSLPVDLTSNKYAGLFLPHCLWEDDCKS